MPAKKPSKSQKTRTGKPAGRPPTSAKPKQSASPSEAAPSKSNRPTGPVPEFVGTGELASLLDYTSRHVVRLVQEGVLVKEGHGSFNLKKSIASIMAHKLQLQEVRAQETAGDRLKETRRQDVERKMAREDRTIIALDEATDGMDMVVGFFVEVLDTLPARVTRDHSIRADLQSEIVEIRKDLAARVREAAEYLRSGRRST